MKKHMIFERNFGTCECYLNVRYLYTKIYFKHCSDIGFTHTKTQVFIFQNRQSVDPFSVLNMIFRSTSFSLGNVVWFSRTNLFFLSHQPLIICLLILNIPLKACTKTIFSFWLNTQQHSFWEVRRLIYFWPS